MREFTFTIEYESGVDPVMDVCAAAPNLHVRSLGCHADEDSLWRLDRAIGPSKALSRLDAVFLDSGTCNDCLGASSCEGTKVYERIGRGRSSRTYYSRWPNDDRCRSVDRLAAKYLRPGIWRATREGRRYQWDLLVEGDDRVGLFYDAVQATQGEGTRFVFEHLREAIDWGDVVGATALPPDQRTAVEAAVRGDYYDEPRGTTVASLADELSVPTSTLSYRLRRAEARLVHAFVASHGHRRDALQPDW